MNSLFVQIGVLGSVGRFVPAESLPFRRGDRVVCRTTRGLETGHVLAVDRQQNWDLAQADGQVLRRISDQDEMLIQRLQRNRKRALEACTAELAKRQIQATLIDAEHLFDGQSLYFYFLGDVSPELETLTSELAETYDAKVRFSQFSEKLANGCGPGCGTRDCGSACSTCLGGCGLSRAKQQANAGAR